jgi:glucose/arabinose dehydrogenase
MKPEDVHPKQITNKFVSNMNNLINSQHVVSKLSRMKTIYRFLAVSFLLIQLNTASCKEMQPVSTMSLVPFATSLVTPVCISTAGDNRLFSVDQHGMIVIIDAAGNVNPVPFLDIRSKVTYGGERGLLGLAFHPNYKTNGFFYVNYVGAGDSTHISRFTVSNSDPAKADPSSEYKLLTLYQPYTNHNGGDLCFGPDGYLYIGLGDGGSGGDPGNRAQNLSEYLGKIHRIDVNNGSPYSIPQSNPFYNNPAARKEIWAYGLRNPWRFSFDRLTGDLWIADVGQDVYEEINFQPAASTGGENYGWRCYEGNTAYNTTGCGASSNYAFPAYAYPHNPECSVIGGYVDRSSTSSPYYGYYFFSDYCSDKIWTLHQVSGNWVVQNVGQFPGNNFSTFGEDNNGQLYIAGLTTGTIYRITGSPLALDRTEDSSTITATCIPGTSTIRIENKRHDSTEMQLTLFNPLGIACYTNLSRESTLSIDISSLPTGIYLLNIVSNGRNQVQKIIKG